jgi:hypothetical protein
MTDTRDFPLADILSITTGRLLSHRHMDGVYEILNHLTGDNLMTHQLPRAAETCRPALIAQHPFLVDLTVAEDMPVPELLAWLAEAETKHGASFPVTPLAVWKRRNPIAEAVEMFGPDRVIPVVLPEAGKAAS